MKGLGRWLGELDALLRGTKSDPELLSKGTDHLAAGPYAILAVLLGITYGIFMGLYAVLTRRPPCWVQMFATSVKVPALFFLTLVVTFPSLYVFSALLGVRMGPRSALRVVVAALAVNLAVLASFGPITGFFTLTTTSYGFIKLLNVLFFSIAGFLGLGFLLKMLRGLDDGPSPGGGEGAPNDSRGWLNAPSLPASPARRVFRMWLVLYALVGAQMGWVLRPFVGSPNMEFTWFREREANIFIDVFKTLVGLVRG